MIIDTLTHADPYFSARWWRDVLAFTAAASADRAPGEHELRGRDLFVKILDFTTGPPDTAVLESHRDYTDVHIVLDGREFIRVWPAADLTVRTAYDPSTDVMFYEPPQDPFVTIDLRPGQFAVLGPQDAHMPALAAGQPARLRKLVFKVSARLMIPETP